MFPKSSAILEVLMSFCEITPYQLENTMQMIGKDYMLITVEDRENNKTNAMTASWGFMGVLWNKNVCACFIRPQRYTYPLAEKEERFALCFFGNDEKYRRVLGFCGRESGRDRDKLAECGLGTERLDGVSVISEAETVIICKKLYADELKKECFIDKEMLSHYPTDDFHRIYVCEIEKAYKKN